MLIRYVTDVANAALERLDPSESTYVTRAIQLYIEFYGSDDAMTGPLVKGTRTFVSLVGYRPDVHIRIWWHLGQTEAVIYHLSLVELDSDEDLEFD